MSDNLTACIIVFIGVMGPVWLVMQFLSRNRAARQTGAAERAAVEQLSRTAAQMESRMAVLERILDAEVPSWRSSAAATGGVYDRSTG